MSAATLTTARTLAASDRQFIAHALGGRFGHRVRDAAAEALTIAESFPEPNEDDPAAIADLAVELLNQRELDTEEPPF